MPDGAKTGCGRWRGRWTCTRTFLSLTSSARWCTLPGDAATAIEALRRGGRGSEATLAEAFQHSVSGHPDRAVEALRTLLERPELPFTGWTIPIEPLFEPIRSQPAFRGILGILADRAR